MNGLALCAGIGGIEIGLKRAIRGYKTMCFVERDAYAAAIIMERMVEKTLDEAPIWDDIKTFSGIEWRGVIDCVTAGFPCQPVSFSGRRRFSDDERWLWPDIRRIVNEIEPAIIFLENVAGLISLGLESILRDIAEMGYDAKWCCVPASAVGACHERERFFLYAYAKGVRLEGLEPKARSAWPTLPESSLPFLESIPKIANGDFYRNDNELPVPVDRIRCLGNAVVPAQAELAWRILIK